MLALPTSAGRRSTRGRDGLVWNTLPTHLNDFQTWLVDQRNAESPSVVIRAFNGFANFLDDLVTWFTDFLGWMTWIGVTVAGVLISLRFGGVRAAIWALAAFATFALSGLWLESMQTLALMLAAVGLSLVVGIPLGVWAGLSDRFDRGDHARPRRDADHPRVRVPDADRDPLLGRARAPR